MGPVHSLKVAPTFRPVGSHLLRCRVSVETARQLLALSRDRTNRADLRQALHDASLQTAMNATVGGAIYTGAGMCELWTDTRDRLLTELDTRVDEFRRVGAA